MLLEAESEGSNFLPILYLSFQNTVYNQEKISKNKQKMEKSLWSHQYQL